MDATEISTFLSALSAISTLAACAVAAFSAVVSYQALDEIRKQRETTYQPEIIISGGNYNAYNKPLNTSQFIKGLGWDYTYEYKAPEYIAEGPYIIPLPINIYNIGLGTAKNVKISCESDPMQWINLLNEISECVEGEHPFKAEFQNPKFIYINIKSAPYINLTIPVLHKDVNLYKDYILPLSTDKTPHQYVLARYYFYFISAYYYILAYCQNAKIRPKLPDKFPDINIKLEYFDINNKKFEKKFILNFKGRMGYGNGVPGSSSGKLMINEINNLK